MPWSVSGLASERRLNRAVAESKESFGRDYVSASYGTEIPPDNLEELLKSGEPDAEKERGRIVLVASGTSFRAEMEAAVSKRAQRAVSLVG